MPIFEYDCNNCGVSFEKLVRATSAAKVACPRCNSRKIKKRVSCFASHSAGGSASDAGDTPASTRSGGHSCGGSCGGCKGCSH